MKRIFKYPLPHGGYVDLMVQEGSQPIAAKEQHGQPVLYAEVPEAFRPGETLRVHVVLTGSPVPVNACYVDTVMLGGGGYVVHVYVEWPNRG